MDLYVLRFSCARRGSFVQRLKESRVFVSGRVRTYVASGGLAGAQRSPPAGAGSLCRLGESWENCSGWACVQWLCAAVRSVGAVLAVRGVCFRVRARCARRCWARACAGLWLCAACADFCANVGGVLGSGVGTGQVRVE
eukprot:1577036-Prymnesium_polylepis.3